MLRGRLGRRVFETETHLLVIRKANRFLMQHVLRRYPDRIRVFWYNNSAEEEQLYSDYLILVQRTGFRPPRMVVEQNIREIGESGSKQVRPGPHSLLRGIGLLLGRPSLRRLASA